MCFYNRELDLLQPFRLRWYYSNTQRINIIWRCHTLYMLQSFGLVWYA